MFEPATAAAAPRIVIKRELPNNSGHRPIERNGAIVGYCERAWCAWDSSYYWIVTHATGHSDARTPATLDGVRALFA